MSVEGLYDDLANNYDNYYASKHLKAQNLYFKDYLGSLINPDDSVLDVGCADGALLRRIFIDPEMYCGVDISHEMINKARNNYPHHYFTCKDFLSFNPLFEGYDWVLSLKAPFTYILEPEKAVKKLYNVLNDGGRFILQVYADEVVTPVYGHDKVFNWREDNIMDYFDVEGLKVDYYGFEWFSKNPIIFPIFKRMPISIIRKSYDIERYFNRMKINHWGYIQIEGEKVG